MGPDRNSLEDSRQARAVDSWKATLRLVAVAAAIVVFYVLGRWVAEVIQTFTASGGLPSF